MLTCPCCGHALTTPNRRPLTERQTAFLAYLRDYCAEHQYSPTYQEIADHFGYRSLATVAWRISVLEDAGYLRRWPGLTRNVELIP